MPSKNPKNIFLPKELNKNDSLPVCIDLQNGPGSTEMHWHSCAEIIHIRKGSAMLFCREKWEMLTAPDTIFLPPGHLHCCHCPDPEAARIVIGLDERLLPSLGSAHAHALAPLHPGAFDGTLIFRQSGRLTEVFEALASSFEASPESESGENLAEELRRLLLVQRLYCDFLEVWEKEGSIRRLPHRNPVIIAIEKLIEAEFDQPLTAEDTARRLNISYSHMANLLRWELGCSFGDLLSRKRVDAAKRLLLTTDFSITEVGLNVGFTDSSYFTRKFRTMSGTTPHKYRAENLKLPDHKEERITNMMTAKNQTGNDIEEKTRDDSKYAGMDLREYPYAVLPNSHGEPEVYCLDVISPLEQSESPRPVVIFVHGGGFIRKCDKRQGYIPVFAQALTKAGYIVVSPDYPTFDNPAHRDAMGGDKKGAEQAAQAIHETYLFIQKNAAAWHLDASRIAIMGGSAGGMTGFAAIANYEDPYRLFVNCWGAPDFYVDLEKFPPVLSIHGTEDQSVDYQLELPIQDRLEQLGIRHQLITLEGSRHTPMDRFEEFIPTVLSFLSDTM